MKPASELTPAEAAAKMIRDAYADKGGCHDD